MNSSKQTTNTNPSEYAIEEFPRLKIDGLCNGTTTKGKLNNP
jgi:hypothetical protein